jgi:hypothetical protein
MTRTHRKSVSRFSGLLSLHCFLEFWRWKKIENGKRKKKKKGKEDILRKWLKREELNWWLSVTVLSARRAC